MDEKPILRKTASAAKGPRKRQQPWPWPEFAGKRVLVTGASRGIGLATARAFQQAGADVLITGTRETRRAYTDDLEGLTFLHADFAERGTATRLAEEAGAIDVLVNNAGTGRADEYQEDGFRAVIDVNLNAVMDMCVAFHPQLRERQGAVVNMGSLSSFLSLKETPAYTASKAAILGLTRALADKWAPDNIRVNMVAPGFIQTRMTEIQRTDPAYEAKLLKVIPMRRWGDPDEVAQTVLFLSSPRAPYITGQHITIDGGLMLR